MLVYQRIYDVSKPGSRYPRWWVVSAHNLTHLLTFCCLRKQSSFGWLMTPSNMLDVWWIWYTDHSRVCHVTLRAGWWLQPPWKILTLIDTYWGASGLPSDPETRSCSLRLAGLSGTETHHITGGRDLSPILGEQSFVHPIQQSLTPLHPVADCPSGYWGRARSRHTSRDQNLVGFHVRLPHSQEPLTPRAPLDASRNGSCVFCSIPALLMAPGTCKFSVKIESHEDLNTRDER